MERLTIPDEKIDGGMKRTCVDSREVKKYAMTLYWALKKYEDTGLTPEQVQEVKEREAAKKPTMDEKKVREAIELIRMEINTLEGIENCGRVIEARKKKHIALYNITIEALEKQLPKKPTLEGDGCDQERKAY